MSDSQNADAPKTRTASSLMLEAALNRYAKTKDPKQYVLEAFDEWLTDETSQ